MAFGECVMRVLWPCNVGQSGPDTPVLYYAVGAVQLDRLMVMMFMCCEAVTTQADNQLATDVQAYRRRWSWRWVQRGHKACGGATTNTHALGQRREAGLGRHVRRLRNQRAHRLLARDGILHLQQQHGQE